MQIIGVIYDNHNNNNTVSRRLIASKHTHDLWLPHMHDFFQRWCLPDGIESQIKKNDAIVLFWWTTWNRSPFTKKGHQDTAHLTKPWKTKVREIFTFLYEYFSMLAFELWDFRRFIFLKNSQFYSCTRGGKVWWKPPRKDGWARWNTNSILLWKSQNQHSPDQAERVHLQQATIGSKGEVISG